MKYTFNPAWFIDVPELVRRFDPADPERGERKLFQKNTRLSFMDTHFARVWSTGDWGGYTALEDQYLFGNWDGPMKGRPMSAFNGVGDRPAVVRGIHTLFSYDRDGFHDFVHAYGNHGDRRISGDWNGDGRDTVAAIRGNCVYYDNNQDDVHDEVQCYGDASNKYFVGDWDGDGKDNIAVQVDGICIYMDYGDGGSHEAVQCYGNGTATLTFIASAPPPLVPGDIPGVPFAVALPSGSGSRRRPLGAKRRTVQRRSAEVHR